MSTPPSQIDIPSLIQCFKISFTSTNTAERTQAEQLLLKLEQNPTSFINLLCMTLESSDPSLDNQVKLSISNHLTKLLTRFTCTNKLNFDEKKKISLWLVQYLTKPNISTKTIENISLSLKLIIDSVEKESSFLQELSQNLPSLLQNVQFEGIGGFLQILIEIAKSHAINQHNYEIVVSNFFQCAQNIFILLLERYKNLTYQNNKDEFKMNITFLLGVFKFFHHIILGTMQKKLKTKYAFLFNMVKPFIQQGSELIYNSPNEIAIAWTGNGLYDHLINDLKVRIFRFIECSFTILKEQQISEEEYKLFENIIKLTTQNLNLIITQKLPDIINLSTKPTKVDSTLQEKDLSNNYNYSTVIYRMLSLLAKTLKFNQFQLVFKNEFFVLYKNILLPLLIISKEEIELASENSCYNDYVIFMDDVIENQKMNSIKAGAAMLLLSLYKSSDVMTHYSFKYALLLLMNALNIEPNSLPKAITNDIMQPNDQILVLLNNQNDKQADLALMILSILSDFDEDESEVEKNNLITFQTLFEFSLSKLLNVNLPIFLRHKVLILIKRYVPLLYSEITEQSELIIKFLFTNLFQVDQLLLSKESGMILSEEIKHLKIPSHILKDNLPLFENNIKSTKVLDFFDLLFEIKAKIGCTAIDIKLFEALCKRVNQEVERNFRLKFKVEKNKKGIVVSGDPYPYKILVNKCFNIIRMMLAENNSDFVVSNEKEITNALAPLYKYMKEIKKIEFDEDLILIMTNIIQHLKTIPTIGYELLINLHKYPEKNNGMLLDLYQLVNCYMEYGLGIIESNTEYLKGIYDLFQPSINDIKFSKSPFYIYSLLQIWFMKSQNAPSDYVNIFLKCAIDKLSHLINLQNIMKAEQYNYCAYLTFIYISLIHYSQIVSTVLAQNNKQDEFLFWNNKLLQMEVTCSYQFKCIILAISHLINSGLFDTNINFFITFGFRLLLKQRNNEVAKRKKKNKRETKCDFVDESDEEKSESEEDDDDDDDEGDAELFDDDKEIESLVEHTINKVKDVDEYVMFRKAIEEFKTKNEGKYMAWLETLSAKDKSDFDYITQVKRIVLVEQKRNGEVEETSVPRKIVKIKRK